MDRLYERMERKKRCVDDMLLYDESIVAQFHRTCEALDLGGRNGALFNPKKFQFCSKKVEYVGLVLDEDGARPPDEFLESIRYTEVQQELNFTIILCNNE